METIKIESLVQQMDSDFGGTEIFEVGDVILVTTEVARKLRKDNWKVASKNAKLVRNPVQYYEIGATSAGPTFVPHKSETEEQAALKRTDFSVAVPDDGGFLDIPDSGGSKSTKSKAGTDTSGSSDVQGTLGA